MIFLAGSVESPGEVPGEPAAHARQGAPRKSDRRIPKPSVPFNVTFISILLAATSPFSSGSIHRDACRRHGSSRSVFDQLLDEL